MGLGFFLALSAIISTIPHHFQGRYADAVGSCKSDGSLHIRDRSIEWNGKTDRVLFAEEVSPSSIHLFVRKAKADRGLAELHFEIQGNAGDHLIVIDHLSDAEDISAHGAPIPDKSTIGFYQRCAVAAH